MRAAGMLALLVLLSAMCAGAAADTGRTLKGGAGWWSSAPGWGWGGGRGRGAGWGAWSDGGAGAVPACQDPQVVNQTDALAAEAQSSIAGAVSKAGITCTLTPCYPEASGLAPVRRRAGEW